jgi:hypothetical protein
VLPAVLAWLAALAICAAAVLFGQTARTAPRPHRPRSRGSRIGLAVSLSGPWLAVLFALLGGALTGTWVRAAAAGAIGVVVAAVLGVTLHPH